MNQDLVDRVLQSSRLPSLPAVALEVIAIARDPDVDFDRVVQLIQHDPALSSRMLQTVNSAFFGQSREVSTISRALQVLGLNAAKTLALGFTLVDTFKEKGQQGFDHVAYWRRSLFTATAARSLSGHVGILQHEEAFLGGLLQDLGMVTMSQVLETEYASVLEQAGTNHASLREHEVEAFGSHHAEVGAALMEAWGLPPLLVALIRHHEDPDGAEAELRPIVRCVALGNRAAEVFLTEEGSSTALATYHAQAADWFDIGSDEAEVLIREIHTGTQDVARLLELPTGIPGDADEVLARAKEALIHLTLESQLENRRLQQDVSTDALTGVANRRAFDQALEQQFAGVSSSRPLGLLTVDIDHFKRFNDTHGHALGDRVLIDFAQTLQRTVGDRGMVYRCGGEEFGILCSGIDTDAAVRVAEEARQAVEQTPVVTDEAAELRITCSVGVAIHTGSTFDSMASLLKGADEALYDAKAAGRNCVRLWQPTAAVTPSPI